MFWTVLLTWCNKTEENVNNQWDEKGYSEAAQICEERGWKIIYDELESESPMCYFLEAEWCSFASIQRWDCVFLNDESYWEEWSEENQWGWERINLVTEMCNEKWWIIEYVDNWGWICRFNERERCFLNDVAVWSCHLLSDSPMCPDVWEPVCWNDWRTYSNRCFLEAAWVEEDTEAEITKRWCVFG
jgi:hypothetical protein